MKEKTFDFKKILIMVLVLGVTFCLVYLRFASYKISEDSMRILELSYKDGFISAGLIGTVYRFLNMIVPIELFDYEVIYVISKHMLVFYYVMVALLVIVIYYKKRELFKKNPAIICLFVIFTAGMFGCADTLGSFDMFEMIMVLFTMLFLFLEKAEWLSVPAVLVGMLIHPSFLFKGFLIVGAVMIYKWKIQGGSKYKGLFITTLTVAVVTFIASEASLLVKIIGNTELLNERIIREGSAVLPEWAYHGTNYINLVLFLLFFSPYLLIGRDFFKRLYKRDLENVKVYRLLQLGALFILPEFILKVEYGFLIYIVIMYYVLLIMYMLVKEDDKIIKCIKEEKEAIRDIIFIPEVLVLYPLLLMPFIRTSIMRGFDVISKFLGA